MPQAPARDQIDLGEPIERHHRHIGRDAPRRDLFRVEGHLVVDLIRDQEELAAVLAAQFCDLLHGSFRDDGARRVVRVDHADGLGLGRDLAAHVVEVGLPAFLLDAPVRDRLSAKKAHDGNVGRIGGAGHEDFVARFDGGAKEHLQRLADTRGDEHIFCVHADVVAALLTTDDGRDEFRVALAGRVAVVALQGGLV